MKKEKIMILACYASVYIVWGTTYFFIKMAVETIPPLVVLSSRWSIAGLFFLLFCLIAGKIKPLPTRKEVFNSIYMGFFLLAMGNGFVTFAEKKVDSYLTALILANCPIAVAFFDRFLLKKRISWITIAGMIIGITGVAILLYDGQSISASLNPEILMLIGAVLGWSFATSLGHRVKSPRNTFVNTGIQMLFVGIFFMFITLIFKPNVFSTVNSFSFRSIIGFSYITVMGSLTFGAYNYLIKHEPAIRIISYALVNPIIAVLLGLIIGTEKPVPFLMIGFPMILIGLFLLIYGKRILLSLRK